MLGRAVSRCLMLDVRITYRSFALGMNLFEIIHFLLEELVFLRCGVVRGGLASSSGTQKFRTGSLVGMSKTR
jgi:hypothetical protein